MKAVGLLSGGLDSALALKLIKDMGVEVVAVKFTSPLCQRDSVDDGHAALVAQEMGIELKTIAKDVAFLEMIRHPKHGYGSALNPCIDCRIFMLKHARILMEEIGASFIITGEVLNQRPMSQYRRAMDMVEKEAGVEGLLVRPLSAKHFAPSDAEKNGWIDREKLLALEGRGRRPQLDLAKQLGMKNFASPAGGCLLTDRSFASKLRDMFRNKTVVSMHDVGILKVGRHYRVGADKVISGKDNGQCKALRALAKPGDWVFDPMSDKGALVLLQKDQADAEALANAAPIAAAKITPASEPVDSFDFAARLSAAYSDGDSEFVTISARQKGGEARELKVKREERDTFKYWKL